MDPVAICNRALGWIGANRITTLDDESAEASLCQDSFDLVVLEALEARAWSFATGFVTLDNAQVSEDGRLPSKWGPLPATVVAVRAADDGSGEFDIEFDRVGEYVHTELILGGTLTLRVTSKITDPAKWTPTFGRCVSALLAADLSIPLTEGTALEDRMRKRFAFELAEAGMLDAMQASPMPLKVGRNSLKARR